MSDFGISSLCVPVSLTLTATRLYWLSRDLESTYVAYLIQATYIKGSLFSLKFQIGGRNVGIFRSNGQNANDFHDILIL